MGDAARHGRSSMALQALFAFFAVFLRKRALMFDRLVRLCAWRHYVLPISLESFPFEKGKAMKNSNRFRLCPSCPQKRASSLFFPSPWIPAKSMRE
jgi:hypothetical protein